MKRIDGWLIAAFGLAFLLVGLEVITPELANVIWPSAVVLFGLRIALAK